jgi:hypothetical protein
VPQAQLSQPYPQPGTTDLDLLALSQPLLQFCQGQIRLPAHCRPQKMLYFCRQLSGRAMPQLPRSLLPPGLQLLGANLIAVAPTHAKLGR